MLRFIQFVGFVLCGSVLCGFMGSSESSRFSGSMEYKPQPPTGAMIQSDDQIWKNFAKCKVKTDQNLSYSITYAPAVKALNGKNVSISGFMQPLEAKETFRHFLLSKNAPTCAFCPPGAPNEVVEVFSAKPTRWKEIQVTFSGTLNLVNDGKTGVFFQMKDAEER